MQSNKSFEVEKFLSTLVFQLEDEGQLLNPELSSDYLNDMLLFTRQYTIAFISELLYNKKSDETTSNSYLSRIDDSVNQIDTFSPWLEGKEQQRDSRSMAVHQIVYLWNGLATYFYRRRDYQRAADYFAFLISTIFSIKLQRLSLLTTAFQYFADNHHNLQQANPMDTLTASSAGDLAPSDSSSTLFLESDLTKHNAVWNKFPVFTLHKVNGPSTQSRHRINADDIHKALYPKASSNRKQSRNILHSAPFCSLVYLYSDALAGNKRFYHNNQSIRLIISLLKYYHIECVVFHQNQDKSKMNGANHSNPFPDSAVVAQLVRKFQLIYCQMNSSNTPGQDQFDVERCLESLN